MAAGNRDWEFERCVADQLSGWSLAVHADALPDQPAVISSWDEVDIFIEALHSAATGLWGEKPKVWTLDEVRAMAREIG